LPRFKIRSVARTRLGLPPSRNAVQQSCASSRTGIGEQPSIKQGCLAEHLQAKHPAPCPHNHKPATHNLPVQGEQARRKLLDGRAGLWQPYVAVWVQVVSWT